MKNSSKRVLIITDFHFCQLEYYSVPRDEKLKRLIEQINEEYKKEPFEFILFLGDYSLDFWQWVTKGTYLTEGKSYTAEFIEKLRPHLPTPYYMIAGNHEQYGEEKWKEITGFSRSGVMSLDDFMFILWDSYGENLDPAEHSDGTYTPIDVEKVRKIMEEHKDKKFFLCSHHFVPAGTEDEKKLINDSRVICLFTGHTHKSNVLTLPEDYGCKKLVQCGSWAEVSTDSNERCWGVRDVHLYNDKMISRYIVPDNEMWDEDGKKLKFTAHLSDEIEILF